MANEKFLALEQTIQQKYGNTAGLAVAKKGELVYETYFNGCSENSFIHVFSVT